MKPQDAHISVGEPRGDLRHLTRIRKCKDASAIESESGLIPESIGQSGLPTPRKGDGGRLDSHGGVILLCCPQGRRKMNAEGTNRKLESPPVKKRQPRRFTRPRLRPGHVETSGSRVRQGHGESDQRTGARTVFSGYQFPFHTGPQPAKCHGDLHYSLFTHIICICMLLHKCGFVVMLL